MKKKIAFIINFNPDKWLGGMYVIKNLIFCIKKFSNNNIKTVLIVKKDLTKKELKIFKGLTIVKTNLFYNEGLLKKIYNKIIVILLGNSYAYEQFFSIEKIDVVSHINVFSTNLLFGKKSLVKSLSFIPDLQHIHLKKNFSFHKIFMRNLNIFLCGLYSSKILLSSSSAKKDIRKISKTAYKKSFLSKFVFKCPEKKDISNIAILKKKYKFNTPYFYLPNQYWVHKNHEVVLKALKYIKHKFSLKKILIISSGSNEDHRNPDYIQKIKHYISKNNLKDCYHYIGVIPYKDVLSLMYHSIALINPSKFEGRSSTVEQAKSMGKKIILSNIPVHKEQKPRYSKYFEVGNFKKLAHILMSENNVNQNGINLNYNDILRKNNEDLLNYYKSYIKLISE